MKYSFCAIFLASIVVIVGCTKNTSSVSEDVVTITPTLLPPPTITVIRTEQKTPAPSPIMLITPTVTSIPEPFLFVREPTIEQVKAYLTKFIAEQIQIDFDNINECDDSQDSCVIYLDHLYYDVGGGFGKTSEAHLKSFANELSSYTSSLFFEDVNGDGEDDLVVLGVSSVVIFIWQGNYYDEPYIVLRGPAKYVDKSQVYFEDWTRDNIPEIIFDYRDYSGGTGLAALSWFRHIIHCKNNRCQVVWHNFFAEVLDWHHYNNGLVYTLSDIQLTADKAGQLAIQTHSTGFDISMSDWNPDFYNVYTETLSVYSWTGERFDLTSNTIITPAHTIQVRNNLTATNETGLEVNVSWEWNEYISSNGVCQLSIGEEVIGHPFGCKPNFTVVEWQDITNDGQPEIVVTTLSAGTANDVAPSPLVWSEEGCLNQRLLAYQWNEGVIKEVANVAGCVIQSDLYGVRLEDWNGDGQPEIVAAANWTDSYDVWYKPKHVDKLYKWNGTEFIFWKEVPR